MTESPDQVNIAPAWVSIGELFEKNYIFRVPKYQRGYAWGDSQLNDFMSDLGKCFEARSEGARRHHLFGGILSKEGPLRSRNLCDLIDGQQRLATFIIFVSHLILQYRSISAEAWAAADTENHERAEKAVERLTTKYLQYDHDTNRQQEKMDRFEFSSRDQQFFKDIIIGAPLKPRRDSHRKLKYAFDLVERELGGRITPLLTVKEKLAALEMFEDILREDCTVIHILANSRAEAYRLFQVLNDRGINLTEGDLLRARTLELLSSPDLAEYHRAAESAWDEILEDPPTFTTNFLKWFYASVEGGLPDDSELFDEFLTTFFPQHEKTALSKSDAKAVVGTVKKMQEEVAFCRNLIKGKWPKDPDEQIDDWDQDRLNMLINALEHKLCVPLLLAAASSLSQQKFLEIVKLLERIAFRYKNISGRHPGSLSNIYYAHAVSIRKAPAAFKISSLKNELHALQTAKAPDDVFITALSNKLAYREGIGNKSLRYFLITAEYYYQWYKGGAHGHPKCRDKSRVYNFKKTSIEHIYPLKADSSVKDKDLELLKNVLGNLSFLGPEDNNKLANENFASKKRVYAASSVEMNREIAKRKKWSRATIEAREEDLKQLALKVFDV